MTSKASRGKPRMQETIGITTDSGETATENNTITFNYENYIRILQTQGNRGKK
jgi:hypothetical protein